MPILKNPKHERFAEELAKGKTSDESFQIAGYSRNRGNATRLKAKENIKARVAELQERTAKRAEVTVDSLLAEAEAARRLAMDINQPSAAIAAVKEKGVLSGKRVERSEQGLPGDFDDENDADALRKRLVRDAEAAGAGDLAAALARGERKAGEQLN